jgi:hypothetical protein
MQRPKTCFVSSPYGADTTPLTAELEERGIEVVDGRSVSVSGSIRQTLAEQVARADFCLAVLPNQPSPNAFIEIGLALGLAKPLALLVDRDVQLPSDLSGLTYIRAPLSNRPAIALYLDAFLAHYQSPKASRIAKGAANRLSKADYDATTLQISAARGQALEGAVREMFGRAGYVVAPPLSSTDKAADFAVWFDDLQASLGNPVLVEVKGGQPTAEALAKAEDKLRTALQERAGRLGLLVYRSPDSRELSANPSWPLIIRISTLRLAEALHDGSLGREILDLRNSIAHGVGSK